MIKISYFSPYIDSSGLHIPLYSDIINALVADAQTIFGQNIYLGEDSQDYQFLSSIASKIYDTFLTLQLAYNNFGPQNAIGTGLDSVVKLNGIKREIATYSSYNVTLTGTAGTVINSGVILDNNGVKWDLPSSVTLGSGTTSSIITCEQPGPLSLGNSISIASPVLGWTGVTAGAIIQNGTNTEADSSLKSRQTISAAIPSKTVFEGTIGAVASISGVTRYKAYENDTNLADTNGLQPHSIAFIVEGGSDSDIANAIYIKKSPGCYTNGTTSVIITDIYGNPNTIRFYRPTYVDIDVVVNVKSLNGYTTQDTTNIKAAIVSFLNSLAMGINDIPVNNFYGPALAVQNLSSPTFSITSITAARHGGTQGTSDITTAFNEAIRGNTAYITVNVS